MLATKVNESFSFIKLETLCWFSDILGVCYGLLRKALPKFLISSASLGSYPMRL